MKRFWEIVLTVALAVSSPTKVVWALSTSLERLDESAGGQTPLSGDSFQQNLRTIFLAQASPAESSSLPVETLSVVQGKIFKTKYTQIYYSQDADLDDFIWRLGGRKLEFTDDPDLASSRIDRLVNRVQMILDMWPENFQIAIYLSRSPLEKNEAAYYEYRTRSIHVFVDHASDGVLAHELAHANIDQYFDVAPPSKMQEILAQYVDKNLWSDY